MTLPTADPTHCPLCGQPNQCAAEVERETGVKQPPCWCTQVTFDAALLSSVPEEARGTACICAECAGKDVGNAHSDNNADCK